MNPSDTLIGNPYEWSHSVSVEDIDSHSAFRWGEESVEYYLSKTDIKDLVYALNDVLWKEFEQGNAIADSEFTVVLQCGSKEYLLTYGSGETMISFENMWRMGLYAYKYKLELSGRVRDEDKDVHFVVLSNDKNLSFEEVLDSSVGEELPIDEAAIVFSF